jgi:hypothetical protein
LAAAPIRAIWQPPKFVGGVWTQGQTGYQARLSFCSLTSIFLSLFLVAVIPICGLLQLQLVKDH